ncbi:integrase [Xenorhabdus mauleonii]|uniref:Integrase n=1 Tax=Xenorhabdus mauleonii TaxID=351675 RepID=A0A2G0N7H9_9GAMM|nr:integrase [Xenorhabdus mauleonii]
MKYYRPTNKKEDRLAFGVYPTVPLADERSKRDEAKKLMAQGIDPKAEKKALPPHRKSRIHFNRSPVHGTPAINAGATATARKYCAALGSIFSPY